MATTTIQQKLTRVEIHLVFRFPFYFYSRLEDNVEVVPCLSITPARAREIYEANQGGKQIAEGQPFNDQGQAWAWSAWVTVEGDDGSQRP